MGAQVQGAGETLALYVRGLPTECTEADLEKLFSEYGPLRKGPRPAVSIYPNKNPPKNPALPHGRSVHHP